MLSQFNWSVRLAIAELRNEWLFSAGVAFAVCSILTTTSLLWGTKSGLVAGMRERLLQDPVNRELISREDNAIPLRTLREIGAHPSSAFLVPSVRRISLYGEAFRPSSVSTSLETAFLPTAENDPIGGGVVFDPVHPQIPVPCMVSSLVAEELNLAQGDDIVLRISRHEAGKSAYVNLECKVIRSLSASESRIRAVFLPLAVIERIEDYKEGLEVGMFGWHAFGTPPLELYDSVDLRFDEPIPAQVSEKLIQFCAGNFRIPGEALEEGRYFRMGPSPEGVPLELLVRLRPMVERWSPEVRVSVRARAVENGNEVQLSTPDESWIPLNQALEGSEREPHTEGSAVRWVEVVNSAGERSRLGLVKEGQTESPGAIMLTLRQAGAVGAAKRRSVDFNEVIDGLRPLRTEFPGFRLYARSLEDVAILRRACQKRGIEVETQEDRIEGVLSLDMALGRFLAFIVLAGGLGGLGALASSIYLSVQRSKRQFAVLQIIGIPQGPILLSVVFQSALIVSFGTLAAFCLFQIGAWMLESVLGTNGAVSGSVCSLRPEQWFLLYLVALSSAVVATLAAVSGMRFKDPAVIARSE